MILRRIRLKIHFLAPPFVQGAPRRRLCPRHATCGALSGAALTLSALTLSITYSPHWAFNFAVCVHRRGCRKERSASFTMETSSRSTRKELSMGSSPPWASSTTDASCNPTKAIWLIRPRSSGVTFCEIGCLIYVPMYGLKTKTFQKTVY